MTERQAIFFLAICSRAVLSSNETGELNAYYNCLLERYKVIIRYEHMRAIVCYSGEECILNSNSCKRFNSIRTRVEWIKTIDYQNLNISEKISNDYHYIIDFDTNDLKILDISLEDQGVYQELESSDTTIKYYHVTVLDRPLGYPIYYNLAFKPERIFLEDTKIEVLTFFSNMSECICANWSDNKGYKTSYGECFLRVDGQKFDSELEKIIFYFSNKVHCFSKLISRFSKIKSNLKIFRSYVLYEDCIANCSKLTNSIAENNLDLNNQFSYDKYEIVSAYKGSMVMLRCRTDKNAQWKFRNYVINTIRSNFSNDRITVDRFNRLVIRKVMDDDETNFTCIKYRSPATIYLLKVEHRLFDKIYNLFNIIGIYSLMALLVSITCLSRGSN